MKIFKIIVVSIIIAFLPVILISVENHVSITLNMLGARIANTLPFFSFKTSFNFIIGICFAGLACFNKMSKYTVVVFAHFISFLLVVFLLVMYILKLLGYVNLGVYYNYINPYMTALAVGFTLVLAIRSLVIRLRDKMN